LVITRGVFQGRLPLQNAPEDIRPTAPGIRVKIIGIACDGGIKAIERLIITPELMQDDTTLRIVRRIPGIERDRPLVIGERAA
jgi:hypothetical protein